MPLTAAARYYPCVKVLLALDINVYCRATSSWKFFCHTKATCYCNSRMAENSSRIKFDERFFSSQQPLRFAALSTSRCGSVTRGSDSPPGCHSLPLARLRLRLAYPLHGAGKRAYRFYMHYQRNSILFCLSGYDFALLTHCTSTILRFCKAEFRI